MELLESELRRFGSKVDSVHLSFTTDPFMWDATAERPFDEMVELTEKIIRRLNQAGIRVTTLTKGVYPDRFIETIGSLCSDNQYGISIVSLSETFRQEWEPGTAPVSRRLEALARLVDAGATTWASVEPYPTPNVDETSGYATDLLAKENRLRRQGRVWALELQQASELVSECGRALPARGAAVRSVGRRQPQGAAYQARYSAARMLCRRPRP